MKSVWSSLWWKEWREHRVKMAALVAISVFVPTLMGIASPANILAAVTMTLTLVVPLGAMFVAMSAAAGEQSQGTIQFLQALPTPLHKPAAAKLVWAALTVAAPVLTGVALAAAWKAIIPESGPDDRSLYSADAWVLAWPATSWFAGTLAAGIFGGVSILVWMTAAGVNRSDEVRAGAVGLLVALAVWVVPLTIASLLPDSVTAGWIMPRWLRFLCAAAPGGPGMASAVVSERGPQSWGFHAAFLGTALAMHAALAVWFLSRFGRISPAARPGTEETSVAARTADWLAPPRRSPLTALVWKQLRETAPLALMGAAVIVLSGIGAALRGRGADLAHDVASVMQGVWLTLSMFVAIVAGVGAFMDDLRPGLHTFWRSRPVNVNRWFAVKFTLALVVTLVILAIPTAAVTAYYWSPLATASISRDAMLVNGAAGLAVQAMLFAVAAASMALLRQPMYAAIAAVGASIAIAFLAASSIDAAPARLQTLVGAIVLTLPTIAAAIIAWLAVKNDWSLRR